MLLRFNMYFYVIKKLIYINVDNDVWVIIMGFVWFVVKVFIVSSIFVCYGCFF